MTTSTSVLEVSADDSTSFADSSFVADWRPVDRTEKHFRSYLVRSSVNVAIVATDDGLLRLAREKGFDLDLLCQAASEAFDPSHAPGDPINYAGDELWQVLDDDSPLQ